MKRTIQIDREFMNLTVPLTDDEQIRLERSLMREGCLEPITIWRGVILDGHKRYKFCSYEDIEFEVREMEMDSREEAVIWICNERIRSLKKLSPMYRYLMGKWYIAKKILNKEMRRHSDGSEQNPDYVKEKRNSVWDTCSRLADETGLHRTTIGKAGVFAAAMDRIADKDPTLFEAILRKEVSFTLKEIIAMSDQDEKKLGDIRKKRLGRKDIKMRKRNTKEAWPQDDGNGEVKMEEEIHIKTGIKEMPAFDPDMEIRGLALTVPTWINAIARTEKKMDVNIATAKAKEQLAANLVRLQDQIGHMLEVLRCTTMEH